MSHLGWDLRNVTIKSSSGRKQRYVSTQIQFYVWERYMIIQKRMRHEKVNFKTSNKTMCTENYLESMENQLISSGICPRIQIVGDSRTVPKRYGNSTNKSRRI